MSICISFKRQNMFCNWRCVILRCALHGANSLECWRDEEQQWVCRLSSSDCFWFALGKVFCSTVHGLDQAKYVHMYFTLNVWGICCSGTGHWLAVDAEHSTSGFSAVTFQVWMQETCLNILNAQILLLCTCRHKILPGCLGTEPGFQSLFLLLCLDNLYNTIVPFPVPGNADLQFYFKKGFLFLIQKKNKLYRRNKVCAHFLFLLFCLFFIKRPEIHYETFSSGE